MQLIGNYLSPYVRRVAVSLHALDLPFQFDEVMVFKEPERVRAHNPITRIPTLLLDDGEALVESYAILDAIDEMVEPARRLTPPSGRDRRHVMKITAMGQAAMDKARWSFYETRFHPEEKVHQPWIDHNDEQALSGLAFLDELAGEAGDDGWLAGGDGMSQADITAAVAFTFAQKVRPVLEVEKKAPRLARFAARCEAMDIFKAAPLPS